MNEVLRPFQVFIPNKNAFFALLLGAFAILAYAPFGVSAVMLISLSGLFWLWTKATSARYFIQIGLWFGLGFFGVGVSWLMSSMYIYSGMSMALSLLATFIFILFLSLYFAFAGWVVSLLYQPEKIGLSVALIMPTVWTFFELIRASLLGGFPFLMTGNTHLFTWLDGYAPVFGVIGVSFAVSLTAGLLVWMFLARNWLFPSLLMFTIWFAGLGFKDEPWVEKAGSTVDVALLQGNVSQDKKWQPDYFLPTLKTYIGLTKENMSADVIVWPETAIPAYFDVAQKGVLYSFLEDAKLLQKDILLGTITRNKETGEYFNALVNARDPSMVYEKHHLVPFSEFFPFSGMFKVLSNLFDIPFSEFSAGTENPQPMELAGKKVGLSICYEMAFGAELARNLHDSQFLITVSNDAWFADTLQPYQQRQDVQMRALELGREIVRSTNTGLTIHAGIDGSIVAEIPAYEVGALRAEVQPYQGQTPFVKWQNKPIWLLLVLLIGFFSWSKWQKNR